MSYKSRLLKPAKDHLPFAVKRAIVRSIYRQRIQQYKKQVPLFNSVLFELRTKCNGECSFCPASVHNDTRPDVVMEFDLFKKIIEQLADMDFSGRIAYHINTEPLLVPELEKYVALARKALPRTWVQILTNGRVLTTSKAERLMEAGINELTVNHYTLNVEEGVPPRLAKIKDEVLLKYYKPEQIVSGNSPVRNREDRFFRFSIIMRQQDAVLDNRAGFAPNKGPLEQNIFGFCSFPFTQLHITADGRVAKCCQDFYFQDVMGDLNHTSIKDVWYGPGFSRVRKHLLQNDRRPDSMCRVCDFFGLKDASLTPNQLILKRICKG